MASELRSPHLDARVAGILWRLPEELWSEPRVESLPPALARQLDRMEPAMLRGLLVELIYRLESQREGSADLGTQGPLRNR